MFNEPFLHVGINLIFLVPGETGGMEIYARELIGAFQRVAPEVKLTTFVNRELAAAEDQTWLNGTERVVLPVAARNRLHWVYGEQLLLPPRCSSCGSEGAAQLVQHLAVKRGVQAGGHNFGFAL